MNKIALLITFILINLANCQKGQMKIYLCAKDHIVCFKKLKTSELQKVEDKKVKVHAISDLEYFILFEIKEPLEFEENKYGNPFPIMRIDLTINSKLLKREGFLKLKNINKDKPSVSNSSLLEGNFSNPYMIIVYSLSSTINYKKDYIFYAETLQERSGINLTYYQAAFEFNANQYIDVFKNVFQFNFAYDINMNNFEEMTTKHSVEKFQYNLHPYQYLCKMVRTSTGQDGEDIRYKETLHLPQEKKEKAYNMSLIDWFRQSNNMEMLGSMCFQLGDSINFDLQCLKEKTGCELFFKLEKLTVTKYQLNLFTKKDVGYMKASFFVSKNIDSRYEVICDRYNIYTDHLINKNGKETKISENDLNNNSLNRSLIYSTDRFFYCGIQIHIKSLFKLGQESFYLEMNDQSRVELEYGKFTQDGKSRSQKWTKQFPLDFSVYKINYPVLELHLVLIGAATGIVIILFICVSLWICNKFQTLSKGLTRAGSRLSNLSVVSEITAGSMTSNADHRSRKEAAASAISNTGQLESTLASKLPQNKGTSYFSSNKSSKRSSSSRSSRSKQSTSPSSLHSNATSVRVSTNRPSSNRSEVNKSSSFRSDKSSSRSRRSPSDSRTSKSYNP